MDILVRHIIKPTIQRDASGFVFKGRFAVTALFGESKDVGRYQYRQFIKGSCILQLGTFNSVPHSLNNWVAPSRSVSGNNLFTIPGGGLHSHYSEDGEMKAGKSTYFGYRTSQPIQREGIADSYYPNQLNGSKYSNIDTYGIRGPQLTPGLRIRYHLTWEGRIIDTSKENTIVKRVSWDIRADDMIP